MNWREREELWLKQMLLAYLKGWADSQMLPLKKPYSSANFRKINYIDFIDTYFPEESLNLDEKLFERLFKEAIETLNK